MNQRYISILGWVATFTAVCMYVSYIPQIYANLSGNKCAPIQPLAAVINCSLWVAYGLKNGILTITLPRMEVKEQDAKEIPIQ